MLQVKLLTKLVLFVIFVYFSLVMHRLEIIVLAHKVQLISDCICQLNLKNSRCSLHPNGRKLPVKSNDNRPSGDCQRMSASCLLNPLFSVVSFIAVSNFLCYIQKRDVHFPYATKENNRRCQLKGRCQFFKPRRTEEFLLTI